MKKILHISNDDKFICLGKTIFDAVSEVENDYWINSDATSFEYVTFEAKNLYASDFKSSTIVELINTYDLLCIHFMNQNLYPLLKSNKITIPILWIGWGGDYYWLLDTYYNFELFLPQTRRWLDRALEFHTLQPILKKLKKFKRRKMFQTVNKVDFFAPVNEIEYKYIKDNYPNFSPKFVDWNYGYLTQEITQHYSSLYSTGNKVMVGNSATPTNNHLDIFYDLHDILLHETLILPLSYGDTNNYASYIENVAKTNFHGNIEILKYFMKHNDFDNILLNCKALIIGSNRQQAIGTIVIALYLGVTIFLYEKSINYQFFKEKGFSLYTIEDLKTNTKLIDKKLDIASIQKNRILINKLWSLERNVNTISQTISNLDNL